MIPFLYKLLRWFPLKMSTSYPYSQPFFFFRFSVLCFRGHTSVGDVALWLHNNVWWSMVCREMRDTKLIIRWWMINLNDFGDSLTFHLVTQAGQIFHWSIFTSTSGVAWNFCSQTMLTLMIFLGLRFIYLSFRIKGSMIHKSHIVLRIS